MRRYLKNCQLAALAVTFTAGLPVSVNSASTIEERRLSFYHTHTGETLTITYTVNGEYMDSALAEINKFLADFRTGDVQVVDPELLDFIHDVRESLSSSGTFEVISAYRSPETNEMLRARSGGVARNSQHVLGHAVDFNVAGTSTRRLSRWLRRQRVGGVGFYPGSGFVHADVGPIRYWQGR